MARHSKTIAVGETICEQLTVGVIAQTFTGGMVDEAIRATNRKEKRKRDLTAAVTLYYVIALGLFMSQPYGEVLRCLVQGIRWLGGTLLRIPTGGAIFQARARLGEAPLRHLFENNVAPLAATGTPGCFYKEWRLVAIDGTTLALQDNAANEAAFGRPRGSRCNPAWPALRLVAICEVGTRAVFAAAHGHYTGTSEISLAKGILRKLGPGMLCLTDRNFFGYGMWSEATATGARHLWRVKKNLKLPRERELGDGSWLARVYPTDKDRRRRTNGIRVRVIEYEVLEGRGKVDETYRLVTDLLDAESWPAAELARLYPERWEIEGCFDEIKTHLRDGRIVLRSKSPELVRQEVWGLLLAHHAVKSLMVRAAQGKGADPDTMS